MSSNLVIPERYEFFLVQQPPVIVAATSNFLEEYAEGIGFKPGLTIVPIGEGIGLDFLKKVDVPVLLLRRSVYRPPKRKTLEKKVGSEVDLSTLSEPVREGKDLIGYRALYSYIMRNFGGIYS